MARKGRARVNEVVESGKERERVADAIEGWVSEREREREREREKTRRRAKRNAASASASASMTAAAVVAAAATAAVGRTTPLASRHAEVYDSRTDGTCDTVRRESNGLYEGRRPRRAPDLRSRAKSVAGAQSTLSQYTMSPRNAESPECGPL